MPLFGDRLICTHIHDNEGIFDEDNHWLPFDGNINYSRFAEHIRRANYQGSLMLEAGFDPQKYGNVSAEEFLQRAADAAKKLAKMVSE